LLNYGFVAYKALKILHNEYCVHQKLKDFGKSDLSTTIANILGDALVGLCVGPFLPISCNDM
jgi:hypothetical protein